MTKRVDAAARVIADRENFAHVGPYDRETAKQAIAAADAVMFSDEAVELAAKAAFPVYWSTPVQDDISMEEIAGWQEESRQKVRAMITALKEAGDE